MMLLAVIGTILVLQPACATANVIFMLCRLFSLLLVDDDCARALSSCILSSLPSLLRDRAVWERRELKLALLAADGLHFAHQALELGHGDLNLLI